MSAADPRNKADNSDSRPPDKSPEPRNDHSAADETRPKEIGGRGGLDPTRYGDWEKAGRCIDF